MAYDDAVRELYQVPLSQFVAERKRLAGELKAQGDASGAKRLLERKRPTVSAWVVNQLYWHARDAFDEMLATAEQLRRGHLAASADHREAIAKLRQRAAALLEDSGHAASESTLRRVTTTLSALAASGGFDPDPPGALAADRDPPGFEAIGIPSAPVEAAAAATPTPGANKAALAAARTAHEADAEQRRQEELAQRQRAEQERARRRAERHRLETELRDARAEIETRERTVRELEEQLARARREIEEARATIETLTGKLAALADDA